MSQIGWIRSIHRQAQVGTPCIVPVSLLPGILSVDRLYVSEIYVIVMISIPHNPRKAAGSFLPVANTLVLTTHIGFVSIAVIAPICQLYSEIVQH
jgi:hypothetical protein